MTLRTAIKNRSRELIPKMKQKNKSNNFIFKSNHLLNLSRQSFVIRSSKTCSITYKVYCIYQVFDCMIKKFNIFKFEKENLMNGVLQVALYFNVHFY